MHLTSINYIDSKFHLNQGLVACFGQRCLNLADTFDYFKSSVNISGEESITKGILPGQAFQCRIYIAWIWCL